MNLANGLANRMLGQGSHNVPGFGESHNMLQQHQLQQSANLKQNIQQQSALLQQQPQLQQQGTSGTGRPHADMLKYEVRCPHPEVSTK